MDKALYENPSAVNYVHVAVVAPLLGYAGWKVHEVSKRGGKAAELKNIGLALMILAVIVLLYHVYRVYQKKENNSCGSDNSGNGDNSGGETAEGYQRRAKR